MPTNRTVPLKMEAQTFEPDQFGWRLYLAVSLILTRFRS